MKRTMLALLLGVLATTTAQAEGFQLGYRAWDYDVAGFVVNRGDEIDFERDIDIQTRSRHLVELRWDTRAGWAPDFAASYFRIDAGGRREATSMGGIGPIPIPGTTAVVLADADIDDYDLTLRYPVGLGSATAWGGLTLKRLEGTLTTREEDDTGETTETVDETVPLLHALVELPLGKRLQLSLGGNWISYDGNEAYELRADARLRVVGPLFVHGGWQRKRYRIETSAYQLDATLDGGLLGLGLSFR